MTTGDHNDEEPPLRRQPAVMGVGLVLAVVLFLLGVPWWLLFFVGIPVWMVGIDTFDDWDRGKPLSTFTKEERAEWKRRRLANERQEHDEFAARYLAWRRERESDPDNLKH